MIRSSPERSKAQVEQKRGYCMLENWYIFDHDILHICFWTLPAIAVGIVMIVMAVVHNRNQKKRQEEFEAELAEAAAPADPDAAQV